MKKAKTHALNFINHLFGVYNLPRIPVHIHWNHTHLIGADNKYALGVYCYWDNGETPCIHVAGSGIGKTGVLSVIAHEFVHYAQHVSGRDMGDDSVEHDAQYYGSALMGCYLLNRYEKQPVFKLDIAKRLIK